jgi:Tfp pilus assembly protein PilX
MNNESGYVLVGALLILLLLVVIGIAATTSTTLELQIAGTDRINKETFFQADGGTQQAVRLVEESLGTPGGFTKVNVNDVLVDPITPNNTMLVVNKTLSANDGITAVPTDAARDVAYFPNGYNVVAPNAIPHTNITLSGLTSAAMGSGLQMVAGYEGKGRGTAGGGGQILYTIYSQHVGMADSESVVEVEWRHVIGLELDGRY